MKQTPIPEKIDIKLAGCLLTPSTINSINSLIDVITEQQKEIEDLKQYRNCHIDWHRDNNPKPYTAMRGTGEYCMCKEPMESIISCPEGHYNGCDDCGKPIKPQEDIEEVVIDLICEAWDLGYKKDGKNRHLIQKYKDRILAIVKGE